MTIDLNAWFRDYHACRGRFPYVWGGKPDLAIPWSQVTESDCSGWASKMLVMRGFPQDIPRSSIDLMDWFWHQSDTIALNDQNKTTEKPFYRPRGLADVLRYARHDGGRFFICQYNKGGTNRHIFSVCAGITMECASGLHGVGSRDASFFVDEVDGFGRIVEVAVKI